MRVEVYLVGAGGGEDPALGVLQIIHGILDAFNGDDVGIDVHIRGRPPQPDVLGTGLLASLAYVLGDGGGVGMGGVHDEVVHVVPDDLGDALGASAASDLHIDVVVLLHDLRPVLGGDPHMDHHTAGGEPAGKCPSFRRS